MPQSIITSVDIAGHCGSRKCEGVNSVPYLTFAIFNTRFQSPFSLSFIPKSKMTAVAWFPTAISNFLSDLLFPNRSISFYEAGYHEPQGMSTGVNGTHWKIESIGWDGVTPQTLGAKIVAMSRTFPPPRHCTLEINCGRIQIQVYGGESE